MFYLNIPDIEMPIFDIEDSTLVRLKHFATYTKLSDKPKYIKYLTNSTLLDYAGFLCLRTHASLSNDSALQEMIVEGECNLMSERLSLMKPNFLRKYLIKIIEDIQFVNLSNDNIDTLLKICSEYKNKQHIPCSEYCNLHSIEVPWQKCLTLMSNRKINLIEGIAFIPCNQWNNLLVDLFRLIYTKSLHHICRSMSSLAEHNLQIQYLSDKINTFYNSKIASWKNINQSLSLEELMNNKNVLPPCMLFSLKSLFVNHRLAHDPRYRLTLFLKDIGIPLEQTLSLFKEEYSKCGNSGSTCTHNWDQHNKKIEYNIRHTYGTMGSKKNYSMTSCTLIQKQSIQISAEGCCPFIHCSKDELKNILEEYTTISDIEMNILCDLKNSNQPIRACHWYVNYKLFLLQDPLYHSTPTQYYFNAKKTYDRSVYV